MVTDFRLKIWRFDETLGIKNGTSMGDFLKKLAATTRGRNLSDIFQSSEINENLVKYCRDNQISQLFGRLLGDGTFSEAEVVQLTAFYNLLRYMDVSFMICPACKSIVYMSWGWCPYHATRSMEFEGKYEGNDENERFLAHLKKLYEGDFIYDVYRADKEEDNPKKRMFVHWTEFSVVK